MALDKFGPNAFATGSVTSDALATGTIATEDIANGAVTGAKAVNLGRRNLVINGAMQVAQRGTSFTGVQTAAYHLDRWVSMISGVASKGICTISQDSDAPDEFRNSFKLEVTTADTSLDPWAEYAIQQRFEGQDLKQLCKGTSAAKEVTISFWVKSNLTGTYILEMLDDDNSSRHINKTYTIDSANTWEYKSITFEGDTSSSGVLDNDSNKSMTVSWFLAGGSNFQGGGLQTSWGSLSQTKRQDGQQNFFATVSNTFRITGVQLEVGSTATPFEHRTYGEELALCQRYFQMLMSKGENYHAQTMWVTNTPADSHSMALMFPHEMRAAPTGTLFGTPANVSGGSVGTSTWAIYGANGWRGAYDLLISQISTTSCRIDCRSNDGVTAGGAVGLYGGADCYWELDAEL